uniref:Putative LAGLIDADG homing endonuclease n=1 Tax=Gloeotilopsis planctonica TaxID=34157 RepID=A0A1B2RZ16_9CHLO|nr:putative LAGLIDADG homing endonuclease [Gloeotilopsis planctonica]
MKKLEKNENVKLQADSFESKSLSLSFSSSKTFMLCDKSYIEPFFVGLFEGDGCINISRTKNGNLSYGRLLINLKYLPENVKMLQLIASEIGGFINIKKKNGMLYQIFWIAIAQKDVARCLKIFEKYPLLTSRKICQLAHLKKCLQNRSWSFHLETRDFKYAQQKEIIASYKKDFVIPSYFGPWLSGFAEAEGSFRSTYALSFYICQNDDWYILNAIKLYFDSHHKLGINKDLRRPWLDSIQYRVSMTGNPMLEKIIEHFTTFPLLGYKQVSFQVFCEKFYQKQQTAKCHAVISL